MWEADFSRGELTLAEAVATSDLIVLAESIQIDWTEGIAVGTFAVEAVFKSSGSARPGELTVRTGGGLWRSFDGGASITYHPAIPVTLMKPGERLVLFLESDPEAPGGYDIKGITGFYALDKNRVRALPINQFCRDVDMLPLQEFIAKVRALAQR